MPAPTSVPSPLPSTAHVRGAEAVVALFGHFNLYDGDVRAVRTSLGDGNVPMLELDVDLPGTSALPGAAADRRADYRVTLRCVDVSELSFADFGGTNVVSEYAFTLGNEDVDGKPRVHVAVTCAPGCDLDLHCRDVAVTAVARV